MHLGPAFPSIHQHHPPDTYAAGTCKSKSWWWCGQPKDWELNVWAKKREICMCTARFTCPHWFSSASYHNPKPHSLGYLATPNCLIESGWLFVSSQWPELWWTGRGTCQSSIWWLQRNNNPKCRGCGDGKRTDGWWMESYLGTLQANSHKAQLVC